MLAKRLVVLVAALVMGLCLAPATARAQTEERAQIEILAQYYAQYYGVPLELVRRVINRESTFNPRARNGPYYGLMQILPATAHTMGYRGTPEGLLDAETNLIYAVKYLRGAWLLSGGSHDRAVQLYAKGYYYEAKAAGLLEETGLRPGPATPIAPTPPQGLPAEPAPAAPQFAPVVVASVTPQAADTVAGIASASVPLGFLPPARPLGLGAADLVTEEPASAALVAIAAAEAAPAPPQRPAGTVEVALIEEPGAEVPADDALRPSFDLVASTFALLDELAATRR